MMERTEYLEAFGVPEFLYTKPVGVAKPEIQKISTQCLVIETQNPYSFCQAGATQDFLFKMLAAIGLEKQHIQCIAIDATDLAQRLQQYDAKTVLLMGQGLSSDAKVHFHPHHPSEILANETLKREAWEVLKQVQQCLK